MDIVIIGTGNAAYILGRRLKASGHKILQVYGRNTEAAKDLAHELETISTDIPGSVNRNADIYIIAVSDIAIAEVLKQLPLPGKTIVHTAASVSKEVLKNMTARFGVFYPLQSLRKDSDHIPEIPIIIDAGDSTTLEQLQDLAHSITGRVMEANDEERLKLHLAAVFCNNFVNHLYALTEQYCKKEGIDFNMMIPLIKETASRLEYVSPSVSQTGPAVRKDLNTIRKHQEELEKHPQLRKMYDMFTDSIGKVED